MDLYQFTRTIYVESLRFSSSSHFRKLKLDNGFLNWNFCISLSMICSLNDTFPFKFLVMEYYRRIQHLETQKIFFVDCVYNVQRNNNELHICSSININCAPIYISYHYLNDNIINYSCLLCLLPIISLLTSYNYHFNLSIPLWGLKVHITNNNSYQLLNFIYIYYFCFSHVRYFFYFMNDFFCKMNKSF